MNWQSVEMLSGLVIGVLLILAFVALVIAAVMLLMAKGDEDK